MSYGYAWPGESSKGGLISADSRPNPPTPEPTAEPTPEPTADPTVEPTTPPEPDPTAKATAVPAPTAVPADAEPASPFVAVLLALCGLLALGLIAALAAVLIRRKR